MVAPRRNRLYLLEHQFDLGFPHADTPTVAARHWRTIRGFRPGHDQRHRRPRGPAGQPPRCHRGPDRGAAGDEGAVGDVLGG